MLSGAGLVKESGESVHVHATTAATMKVASGTGTIELLEALKQFGQIDKSGNSTTNNGVYIDAGSDAPIYIMKMDDDGSIQGDIVTSAATGGITYSVAPTEVGENALVTSAKLTIPTPKWNNSTTIADGEYNVLVDYYVVKKSEQVSEIQLTAKDFAGYYYVEADTLFRSQASGVDMPANLTFPNVKVQSGFTITMAGTGDPSTFDFTMDAFPGYTYFDKSHQVLCVIQIVEDSESATAVNTSVMKKNSGMEHTNIFDYDSDYTEQAPQG